MSEYLWMSSREDRSAFLELSFDHDNPAILVGVSAQVADEFKKYQDKIAANTGEEGFDPFVPLGSADQRFGWGGLIETRSLEDGWTGLRTPFPVFEIEESNSCSRCGGLGKSEFFPKCLHCDGRGKRVSYVHTPLDQIVATLGQVFETAHYLERQAPDQSGNRLQLFVPTVMHQPRACFVGGQATPVMATWLVGLGERNLPEELEAMKAAWRVMNPVTLIPEHAFGFSAWVRNGGFFCADCPGDATGIHPASHRDYEPGEGIEFSCHNVDRSDQVLALLACLAALCGRAREEGVGIKV